MAGERILVVEDEAIIAKEIEHALRSFGYEVAGIVARGEDALVAARDMAPDLVLMDIMLAGDMDGTAAATAIRAELDVPIVFSTAYTDQETVDRAKPVSPYGYLVKPFEHTNLRITVETALYRSAMERRLRAQEQRLRQAQRMEAVGTFASGMAHDFNNILSAIIGYSEMGLRRVDEQDQLHRMFGRILRAGERARDLVRLLLDFSRPAHIDHEPVDLRGIVDEVLSELRPAVPGGVAIRHEPPDGPCLVRADPGQLRQVVRHLAQNALDAMADDGGTLELRLYLCRGEPSGEAVCGPLPGESDDPGAAGGSVALAVADTGRGMTREVRERAFDPFFTTKPSGEGTGLGLALVHGVVRGYGGWIVLDSAPGLGTRVTVGLPDAGGGGE